MKRFCNRCKTTSEFSPTGKMCKDCNRSYQQEHYKINKQAYKDAALRRKWEVRRSIQSIKAKTPCMDCGRQYPYYVTDYHHLDSTQKNSNISAMITNGYSLKSVLEEIKRCELVCA